MSIDIALKAGIGLLGASAVSLGGYKVHNYLTATLESKYSLMDENDNDWSELVKKHEEENSEGKPKKMDDLNLKDISGDTEKKKKLIDHCKSRLKTSLRETKEILDKRKEEIETWCVKGAAAIKTN